MDRFYIFPTPNTLSSALLQLHVQEQDIHHNSCAAGTSDPYLRERQPIFWSGPPTLCH